MKTMYPAQVNSPGTELAAAIDAVQDTIQVADGSVLPDGPNLLTIGTDEAAETILYTGKTGDELTGIKRGFHGTAQSWAAGTKVARYFTAYDHDAAIGNISELSTGLTAARDRLDTEQRQDVVLNAGMQILNAQRRAAFSLSGIKGRALVNLLGRAGNMNDLSKWSPFRVLSTLESGSAKLTIDTGQLNGGIISPVFSVKAGKHYIALTDIKNGNAVGGGRFYIENLTATKFENDVYSSDSFKTAWAAYAPTADVTNCNLVLVVDGAAAQYAYYDSVRIYEISAAEYTSLDGMTREQIGSKYPYVDSVQPVRNPYAIRYGENLLPPFYEWTSRLSFHTEEPYTVFSPSATAQVVYIDIPVISGIEYTLSFDSVKCKYIAVHDNSGTTASSMKYLVKVDRSPTENSPYSVQFTGPQTGVVRIHLYAYDLQAEIDGADRNSLLAYDISATKPMLTRSSTTKPFKPREDSMLALQTDLFADPLTGANADEVFEKDGQYFKLSKWKKQTLGGSLDWRLNPQPRIGYKEVYVPGLVAAAIKGGGHASKFDGKILTALKVGETTTAGDQFLINSDNAFVLAISNTDSGWGDNYTPTADEIKAYFMGWKMYDGGSNIYPGTGTKYWVAINEWGWGDSTKTSTLPVTQAPVAWSMRWTQPYQLVYQLATPTVEPIVSEGMLTFNEGDNQIEVGTGLVVRESAVFAAETPTSGYSYNAVVPGAGQAKYKVRDFLNVYESGRLISGYTKTLRTTHNGAAIALPRDLFNAFAAYSVSYWMLDKSPIVPFSGSYAANEKSMLQDLTDAVQQNATAVSVLLNKKADKDAPGWITPTLLNGWVNFSTVYNEAGYTKTSNGWVHFRGIIRNGVVGQNIFVLPAGFRPSKMVILGAISHNNTTYIPSAVRVYPDGSVLLDIGSFYHLSLESINPFLAEQ